MTIDAADVVRRLREDPMQKASRDRLVKWLIDPEINPPNMYWRRAIAAEIDVLRREWAAGADFIETLVRERDEALTEHVDMMWQRQRAEERAEAAESALRQANARIAELEGALSQIADTPWSGVRIENGDASYHEMKCLASAALRSQSEETR